MPQFPKRSFRPSEGQVISGYKLIRALDKGQQGANGDVWKVQNSDTTVAMKILLNDKPQSISYQRFRDEIEIMKRVNDNPGVMTILDASIPDQPTKDSPAWYTMPVAKTVSKALGDQPSLRSVVEAIAAYADTLAVLHDSGTSHRDIKPNNLFQANDVWVLGDFGLASFDGKLDLTIKQNRIGALNYMAPEMMRDPVNADGGPADVYSLAKTLWKLGTGEDFPPQGELRRDSPLLQLSSYTTEMNARLLDSLLEHCTLHEPGDRPMMRDAPN